jgi:cytochrome c oxidase cbb3-type subunit I/II
LIKVDLAAQDVKVDADSDLVALIAYLQRLGRGPQPVVAAAQATPGVGPPTSTTGTPTPAAGQ